MDTASYHNHRWVAAYSVCVGTTVHEVSFTSILRTQFNAAYAFSRNASAIAGLSARSNREACANMPAAIAVTCASTRYVEYSNVSVAAVTSPYVGWDDVSVPAELTID